MRTELQNELRRKGVLSEHPMIARTVLCAALLSLVATAPLPASVTLLVGEPFGTFGALNPTGHAAVYLSRVCAETPTLLRRCEQGETGVVISRYHRVAGRDWLAIPLLPYLYSVERHEDVPELVDAEIVAQLRDSYRRAHLRELVPDGPDGEMPKGDWIQLVGSSYDRIIYGFTIGTTSEDDDRLIEWLNSEPNSKKFNLFFRNCADFARNLINFYHPGAVRRSIVADFGIMTPKHAAKALVKYSKRRPELHTAHFAVAQIPGIRPSTRIRGVNESLVRSKKYVVPLLIVQPWVAATALAAYISTGRFNPTGMSPDMCERDQLAACFEHGAIPVHSSTDLPETVDVETESAGN